MLQLTELTHPRTCALQREATTMRSLHTATGEEPTLATTTESLGQQQKPSTAKKKKNSRLLDQLSAQPCYGSWWISAVAPLHSYFCSWRLDCGLQRWEPWSSLGVAGRGSNGQRLEGGRDRVRCLSFHFSPLQGASTHGSGS